MCGRYVITTPADGLREAFRIMNELPNVGPSWNVAPTHSAPVVRRHPGTGARHLDMLHWGLVPHFERDPKVARKPINARAETVRSLASFRGAYAARRCLVPADAFYEWRNWRESPDAADAARDGAEPAPGNAGTEQAKKQPFAVARADGTPMALAGLWEGWRGADGTVLRSFAIVTTDANEALRPLHARMAVIVEPANWPLWLGEADGDPAALLRPSDAALRIWPVSTRVNSVRNNDAALLDPV